MRVDEMSGSGFIIEQIRAGIQQSRLCVADVSDRNPNVLYELGFAQAAGKPVVVISNDVTDLPFDVAGMRIIRYGYDLQVSISALRKAVSRELTVDRFGEVEQLVGAGSFRAAIALAGVVLEHSLRELAARRDVPLRSRSSLGQLASALLEAGILDVNMHAAIRDAIGTRNEAVHSLDFHPSRQQAQVVLDIVRKVAELG